MLEKFKSRKFWVTFAVLVVILFGNLLGLDIDTDRIIAAAEVVSVYLLGQSYVDRKAIEPLSAEVLR